jgi:hypothetical protein
LAERQPGLPVVLMSGYDSDTRLTGWVLAKPVGEDALLRTIRETLDA